MLADRIISVLAAHNVTDSSSLRPVHDRSVGSQMFFLCFHLYNPVFIVATKQMIHYPTIDDSFG